MLAGNTWPIRFSQTREQISSALLRELHMNATRSRQSNIKNDSCYLSQRLHIIFCYFCQILKIHSNPSRKCHHHDVDPVLMYVFLPIQIDRLLVLYH